MYYLSADDVYVINAEVLGVEPTLIDGRLLRAAVNRPFWRMFGQDAYPTLQDKAAALLHSLAHDHLFVDGNKRTAQRAVMQFLQRNGIIITWHDEEAAAFILKIAQGQHDVDDVACWLVAHTQGI